MEAAAAVEKAKAKMDPREREAVRNLVEPLLKSIEQDRARREWAEHQMSARKAS